MERGVKALLTVDIAKKLGNFQLKASFEAQNSILGILGVSGCGKSMTLKCISGIEKPDSGHIELDGTILFDSEKRINLPPQRRSVGYLFQNYALFPNMTVHGNILCGLHREHDRDIKEAALADMIGALGLNGLEKRFPNQLSGGQQQRVALGRILASKPRILLLDEPFSALDTHLREKLQIDMKAVLQDYPGLSIMVTHSRDEAYRVCGQIALMEDGRVLRPQPTKKLFADPGSIAAATMTGCKNIAAAQKEGENELKVPDWGVVLKTALPVRDDVCAVGIRAHYFNTRTAQNRQSIRLNRTMEEPFEFTVTFRFERQNPNSPDLWWRMPKEYKPQAEVSELGVAPENVLPLYPA